MIEINIISNNKKKINFIKNPNSLLKRKLNKLNKKYKRYKKKVIFCTLLLSGNSEIKKLNNKFRKKNKTTDVLSFPFYSKRELREKFKNTKEIYLGDIIVNLNKVTNKKDKKIFTLEFDRLWVHGLVHLLGYDHKKNKDFKKMDNFEKKLLSYIN